jgi:hypothetical protein
MGWCKVGSTGQTCDPDTCEQVLGSYSEDPMGDGGICILVSVLDDNPIARQLVASMVYPPIAHVLVDIFPSSPLGQAITRDLQRHHAEAVSIFKANPDLFQELQGFLQAMVPFAWAVAGVNPPDVIVPLGETVSTYTARRFRPGMADWLNRIFEGMKMACSEELAATVSAYQAILPEVTDLSPAEFLVALRSHTFSEAVDASA